MMSLCLSVNPPAPAGNETEPRSRRTRALAERETHLTGSHYLKGKCKQKWLLACIDISQSGSCRCGGRQMEVEH